ncbi:MAG: ATP synthase F1 subunit delta [Balneolaceae bacterium]
MVLKVARRYAKAFLQIAIEQDIVEETLNDVLTIKKTIDTSRDLMLFLKSPVIKSGDKRKALEEIFSDQIQPITQQFITLLIRKGRENLLHEIMSGFVKGYKDYAGIIDVNVFTAMELPEDQKQKLSDVLERATQKQINFTYHLDEKLIGGLAVRMEDTVIDGTVKHKIDRLRNLLTEASV